MARAPHETHDGRGRLLSAHREAIQPEQANHLALLADLGEELVALRAYIANRNPRPEQTADAVKLVCRVAVQLILLQLRRFDATD